MLKSLLIFLILNLCTVLANSQGKMSPGITYDLRTQFPRAWSQLIEFYGEQLPSDMKVATKDFPDGTSKSTVRRIQFLSTRKDLIPPRSIPWLYMREVTSLFAVSQSNSALSKSHDFGMKASQPFSSTD
jgi:hypothetical protein